jgi:hypothetical protein
MGQKTPRGHCLDDQNGIIQELLAPKAPAGVALH